MCFAVPLAPQSTPFPPPPPLQIPPLCSAASQVLRAVRLPASVHRRLVNFVLHGAFLCTIVIGKTQALPVLAHGVSVHARGLRPRGVGHALAFLAHARVAFRKR